MPIARCACLLACGSGKRSLLACAGAGSRKAIRAWRPSMAVRRLATCRACRWRTAPADADFMERYSRHLRLPQVGSTASASSSGARMLLVGARRPWARRRPSTSVAAGVGFLRLVDDDVVDRSNLQRQILHTMPASAPPDRFRDRRACRRSIRASKVEACARACPPPMVESLLAGRRPCDRRLRQFPHRYLLNDACVHLGKPLVYGAVHRFEGQAQRVRCRPQRAVSRPVIAAVFRILCRSRRIKTPDSRRGRLVLGVLPRNHYGMLQADRGTQACVPRLGESLAGPCCLHFRCGGP
jgi:hypothetical protein